MRHFVRSAVALAAVAAFSTGAQSQTVLKMQATWPASLTLYENFTYFAERVGKISGGTLKIEAMPAGQVVPAFEVLDATHKKVLDGAHAWSGYWTGKSKTAILFTGGPGGTFGMDSLDAVDFIYLVSKSWGIKAEISEFRELHTFGKVIEHLVKKTNG